MINVNCTNCPKHCCGMNPGLTPVLTPEEEIYFADNSVSVQTPHRRMYLLAKKENGNCVFLDENTRRCTIYENRPLECKLFPFLLLFEDDKPNVKLDSENCPNILTLTADRKEILDILREHEFPAEWIRGYDSLLGV